MFISSRRQSLLFACFVITSLGVAVSFFLPVEIAFAQTQNASPVVISQIYGGAKNDPGASFNTDYIEIFNRGTTSVNLKGWSNQAITSKDEWQSTKLAGSLAPGGYMLIKQRSGNAADPDLPTTPDVTGNISLRSGAGMVALVKDWKALSGACPMSDAKQKANIVDFVGIGADAKCFEGGGAAPGGSATRSIYRNNDGCADGNDNAADFATGKVGAGSTPLPRNSSSPKKTCGGA